MQMRSLTAALFLIAALVLPSGAGQARSYVLDSDHTRVEVSWDHLGMSRQAAIFTEVTGRMNFDPARPLEARVEVRIGVKSFLSGVPALDRHITGSKDFFDADKYPDITFVSREVSLLNARTANVKGELTINGITRPATLSVVWNFDGEHPLAKVNPVYSGIEALGFSARTRLLRSDFGITRSIPLVSDELRIRIETELLSR